MKITLKELRQQSNGIRKLADTRTIDIYTKFRLRKFIRPAVQELNDLEEARQALVRSHARPDATGNIVVGPKELPGFTKEFDKLLTEEVDLPNPPKVPLSQLEEADMSVMEISDLEFLIEDDENKKPKTPTAQK